MQPVSREGVYLDRLTTGIPRLDQILDGGIPRYSIVFVAGLPGAGKTVLSQQAVFANACLGRTCLYLSTLSEPPLKILRFLQSFSFFDPQLFGTRAIYGDLGSSLRQHGPAGLIEELDRLIREHRPEFVVIDSFKVLREALSDPVSFREFVSDLAIKLSAWEVTAYLVGEFGEDDLHGGPEFSIGDGIIYLFGEIGDRKQSRYLRVVKMRGTCFFPGDHYFEIGQEGVSVFPRMAPEVANEYQFPGDRAGSVIQGIDDLLGGGLFESTSTLISGAAGAGKTLLALSFLVDGARRGQPALFVSFEESPQQLIRNSRSFGWDLEELMRRGVLDIMHVSPSELNVDRHAFELTQCSTAMGARRVAVDSISAFEAAVPDPSRYQAHLWAITDHFKRNGVTSIMTTEVKGPFDFVEISARAISFVADCIILLRYVEVAAELKRAVGVLKMRGSKHDKYLRELLIAPPRVSVGSHLAQAGMLGSTLAAGGGWERQE